MAMRNQTEPRKRKRRPRQAVGGGTARLIRPPEPSSPGASNGAGIIRPETGMLHLPSGLVEPGEHRLIKRPSPVVMVIVGLALVFIAIITWFVAHEPPHETKSRVPGEIGGELRR